LSIENPNAVGVRPSHPTLCARTQIGDATVVPFTGLATVMLAARAGLESMSPDIIARAARASRFVVWPKYEQSLFTDNIHSPEGG
jgi:hypothetical protein